MGKLGLGIMTGASTEDAVEKKKSGALRKEMVPEEGSQFTESHGRILIRSCLCDRNIQEFAQFPALSLCLIIFPLEHFPTFTRFPDTSLLRATNHLSWKFRNPWVSISLENPFLCKSSPKAAVTLTTLVAPSPLAHSLRGWKPIPVTVSISPSSPM
jgi:hypothetical protein